jgi:hypothetical protein
MPAHLLILNPIFVDSIPFVTPNNLGYPVAALIVIVGDFLHKTHEFGEVVKMSEQAIHLMHWSIDSD